MNLEDLIKAGFSQDQATTILNLFKKAIDGHYVPKQTFEAERDKVKTANDTIADRDKQIEELGKFKGTADELQKKVDALTDANTKAKQEYEQKLRDMEVDTAIRSAIADQVHSADDIMPRLDRTKLTIQEGRVVAGLVEQMDAIKKSSPHYFKAAQGGEGGRGGLPSGWYAFGRSPEEGKGAGFVDSAAEFGKSLAKAQSQGMASTEKAADVYFK